MSPVCGASWARTEDICYKLITVTDAEVAEVTQAANEVDYTTAKVIELKIMIINQTLKSTLKASCEGLATNGMLAGPKTTAIFDKLNALNTAAVEYWVGLDDR